MKISIPSTNETFDIELSENMLAANDKLAAENRRFFDSRGIFAIDILGSVGSGKTTLVQQFVRRLKDRKKVASIAGDLATTIDADRIRTAGGEVLQVNTGSLCHLDASIVNRAVSSLDLDGLDILLIENVGNLICPGEFRLGAHRRLVVVSVTEGPYMIVKHPAVFLDADAVAVNKTDLAGVMEVDPERLKKDALALKPGLKTALISAKTGEGVDELMRLMGIPGA
ncbi:MAG: hydrogenase nickel incorporation protein HypB [bacterium]|nr:hydrogenase nickel incorporation protein HypB [bacterium]